MDAHSIEARTMRKVTIRIVPFITLLYLVNLIDRSNLSVVSLTMNQELGIAATAYGSLAAAFYIGYFFFEVPSNILLERLGSGKWLSRIMWSWGAVTVAMFFVQEFWHVYVLRVLLGVAEAGFFPGIIFYISLWFPARLRARTISWLFIGASVSSIISGPLATSIMEHISWHGYSGWRWVFVIEGVPAIILGVVTYYYLTDRPGQARWLDEDERQWLKTRLEAENAVNDAQDSGIAKSFGNARIWHLAGIYFFFQIGFLVLLFWLPQMISGFSREFSISQIGWIMSLPGMLAIPISYFWGRHSDRTRERKFHIIIPMLVAIAGLAMVLAASSVVLKILGVVISIASLSGVSGPFWTLPSRYLQGVSAAIGLAIINSLASLAGFVGNTAMGTVTEAFGSSAALVMLIGFFLAAIFLALAMDMTDKALTQEFQGNLDETRPHSAD